MSDRNQRTRQQLRVGLFHCTVHLDPTSEERRVHTQHELASVARRLMAILDSHRLPVTWAVSDPAHSAATALIMRSAVEHEMAILGDAYWVGPTAGRTRFARELARRVLQARTAGIQVTTFVPRVASIERHVDLIVKQRIAAVSGIASAPSERQARLPRALHYGVWEIPITASLPARSRWFSTARWSTWRKIRRAAREAATFHLQIDAPALAEAGARSEATIAWLMRRVADLRDRGLVRVQSLGAAAADLAAVPSASPQCSILRRAA